MLYPSKQSVPISPITIYVNAALNFRHIFLIHIHQCKWPLKLFTEIEKIIKIELNKFYIFPYECVTIFIFNNVL